MEGALKGFHKGLADFPHVPEGEGAVGQLAVPQFAVYDIFDKELTPESFEQFMERIYLTGNYTSVRPRIYEENGETLLELNLEDVCKLRVV